MTLNYELLILTFEKSATKEADFRLRPRKPAHQSETTRKAQRRHFIFIVLALGSTAALSHNVAASIRLHKAASPPGPFYK